MATTTATDQYKLCKITNNSGIDIAVTDPLTSAETPNSTSTISYNKDIEVLKTGGGGYSIANDASDTVTLDRTRTNSKTGETEESGGYDLVFTTADWYSPICNIPVLQNYDDDTGDPIGFDPQTVTADHVTAMNETALFYQTVSAYPSSQLATDYTSALSASSATVDGKGISPITKFFSGTKQYTHVTMGNIVAIEGYYNKLPFAWAKFDSASYYLYSSDGKAMSFEGTLVITKPATIDISQTNCGYTCTFNPASNPSDMTSIAVNTASAKPLTYADGLFVDDTTLDMPGVALKGSFQLKRTFTKNPDDTAIIPVISGTINGATCIGFEGSQAIAADDTTQDWLDSLFHPKTAAEIFNSVMQILGALMMLHFVVTTLYSAGKWIKEKIQGKQTPTDQEIATEKQSLGDRLKAEIKERFNKLTGNKDSQVPNDSQDAVKQATTEKDGLGDLVTKTKVETTVTNSRGNLKDALQFEANSEDTSLVDDINDAISDLRDITTKVNNATTPEELKAVLDEVRPKLQEITTRVTKINTDLKNVAVTDDQTALDDNIKEMETINEDLVKEKTASTNEAGDKVNTEPEGEPEIKVPDL